MMSNDNPIICQDKKHHEWEWFLTTTGSKLLCKKCGRHRSDSDTEHEYLEKHPLRINKNHKVVCVCRAGQVRSVAARHILADRFGFCKVLACGWEKNDAETVDMLCAWADVVLVVGRGDDWKLPTPPEKTVLLNVGPDVWGDYRNPQLLEKLLNLIYPIVERRL